MQKIILNSLNQSIFVLNVLKQQTFQIELFVLQLFQFQLKIVYRNFLLLKFMIDWITQKPVKYQHFTAKPIISSSFVFTSDNKNYQNVIASLYQEFVILENKNSTPNLRILLQNGLLFEVIRFKQESGQLGTPRSLKFQFKQKWFQLKNSSIPKDLQLWIQMLTNKINQKGFHDYFQAIKKIGKGGFASVYLVRRKHNNQEIAVKAFSKQAISVESRGLDALDKQIKIMRKLNHKNLMKLYEVFQTENSFYMCIQLLSGGSLFDRIRKKDKLSTDSIKKIMKSILEGLQYMHQKNIMHRDLKPDNVLFRDYQSDDCIIADFGLGQQCQEKQYIFTRCGTPGYVAPQVVNLKNNGQKYTVACDMFSLGIIFHMLALKKAPFQGRSYNQILIKNRNCNIDFQESQYKKIPQVWLDLLKKLLAKDPKKRITATQALDHKFFVQDSIFKQFTQKRRMQSKQKLFDSNQQIGSLKSCESNILLSKNQDRKNNIVLRQDSCLKFKIKQNVMTGKINQSCQHIKEVDSPMIVKKNIKNSAESRFKCRA